MKERILGFGRTFKHKYLYQYGYSKKVWIILISSLIMLLGVLYLIW